MVAIIHPPITLLVLVRVQAVSAHPTHLFLVSYLGLTKGYVGREDHVNQDVTVSAVVVVVGMFLDPHTLRGEGDCTKATQRKATHKLAMVLMFVVVMVVV